MPRPRPPSRVDTLSFPVFGMSWYANQNVSVLGYCGGGGSARTGVTNKIVLRINGGPDQYLDTGNHVCVALVVYPHQDRLWLLGAIGDGVRRYLIQAPSKDDDDDDAETKNEKDSSIGLLKGQVTVDPMSDTDGKPTKDICNAVAVHCMGQVFCVGCESSLVHVYRMGYGNEVDAPFVKLHTCTGHTKAVCAVKFALRTPLIVSSAKDGTARVWNQGNLVDTLLCDVTDPQDEQKKRGAKKPKSKRPKQVLVRGCEFGDMDGSIVYTVASERRGKTFLSKWALPPPPPPQQQEQQQQQQPPPPPKYQIVERTIIHSVPVSACCLSADGTLLTLGGVDGSVLLFDVTTWKLLRQFPEIHDLPITCIAARPLPIPFPEDKDDAIYDGVQMHAISASADSQLALLTLARRAPRKRRQQGRSSKSSGSILLSLSSWINTLLCMGLVGYVLVQMVQETIAVCGEDHVANGGWNQLSECILHSVLIAPSTRPGILVPPH